MYVCASLHLYTVYVCMYILYQYISDLFSLLLSPSAPPQVNIAGQNIDKDEKQNTTFTCMVSGVPEPTITWQFDSNRSSVVTNLTQSDRYTITNSSMTRNDAVVMVTSTLAINGLNLNDTGFYICYATNPAGDDSDRRLLIIRC